MKYLLWLMYLITSWFAVALTWFFAPLISLFYYTELRTDVVKRNDKRITTMPRQYVSNWLAWFTTDDNADDEYFWGWYKGDWLDKLIFGKPAGDWTVKEYSNCKIMQYWARVRWLWRNPAYTFRRDILGFERKVGCVQRVYQKTILGNSFIKTVWTNQDGSTAFLIEGGFGFEPLNNIKLGWKAHKGFITLMLAGRIISFRDK